MRFSAGSARLGWASGQSIWLALVLVLCLPVLALAAEQAGDFGPALQPHEVEAGSLLLEREDGALHAAPTVDTDVRMQITGMVARVAVEQTFTHPGTAWSNGVYVFPLPETAAVDHLWLEVGERRIEGRIKEREAARAIYQWAKLAGKKASLVEQQRPNIFTNRVANIGPGETVKVTIEYQQTLAYDKGRFSIRFPMTSGIRYIPGTPTVSGSDGGGWAYNTDQVPDATSITPPVTEPGEGDDNPVAISVELTTGFPLAKLDSPYHKVRIDEGERGNYRATLDQRVAGDRDFVLYWVPEPQHAPRAALFTEDLDGETYGLLMMMPPESEWGKTHPIAKEIIYVIDTSGSMGGTSIVQAKEALEYGLSRLNPGDYFNIVQFNSTTQVMAPQALLATPTNVASAKAYVGSLDATGGTEMADALRAVLTGSEDASRIRQVIFLTDGSVGNEAGLFKLIGERLGDSRLFTVGIGAAPNSHFMREAATLGRGTFTYIGSQQEVRQEMSALFEKLQYPVLSNIALEWADGGEVDYWPQPVRDLYLHEPLVVSFMLDRPATALTVSGLMSGRGWSTELPIASGAAGEGLDVLWARHKIRSLSQQLSRGVAPDAVKSAITALGLKHHIVTKHTSLVAVDLSPTRPADRVSKDAAVPLKKPQGWSRQAPQGRLPQTATPALLQLLIGSLLAVLGLFVRRFARVGS